MYVIILSWMIFFHLTEDNRDGGFTYGIMGGSSGSEIFS